MELTKLLRKNKKMDFIYRLTRNYLEFYSIQTKGICLGDIMRLFVELFEKSCIGYKEAAKYL